MRVRVTKGKISVNVKEVQGKSTLVQVYSEGLSYQESTVHIEQYGEII